MCVAGVQVRKERKTECAKCGEPDVCDERWRCKYCATCARETALDDARYFEADNYDDY